MTAFCSLVLLTSIALTIRNESARHESPAVNPPPVSHPVRHEPAIDNQPMDDGDLLWARQGQAEIEVAVADADPPESEAVDTPAEEAVDTPAAAPESGESSVAHGEEATPVALQAVVSRTPVAVPDGPHPSPTSDTITTSTTSIPTRTPSTSVVAAEPPAACLPDTARHGTLINWIADVPAAAKYAATQDKLVFVIGVSGNFAREEFT